MILTFNREHLKRLAAATEAATRFAPTFEQLYDPAIRKDGKTPAEGAFPKPDEIDPTKIPPGLWLVGDQGIYFMSNAHAELPKGLKNDVAYAHEANPTRVPFDDWWDVKNRSFGGDDGAEFIELETIEAWLNNGHLPNARLELTPTQFRFL